MTISQALTYGRRALNQMEAPLVRALLDQYGIAWLHIEGRLAEVERYIDLAIARGEVVDDKWLYRQAWWQSTLDSIETEMRRYTAGMAETLANGEWQALQVAQRVTGGITEYVATEAAKRGITITGGIRGQVNPGAFERWVIAQQPDSPIRQAIDRYGDRASESIRKHMTEGLAAGEHPRTIAKRIAAEVGEDATRGQLQTLVRSELHRSYRGAAADSFLPMEESGAIVGYRWSAAKGRRTCIACLAMDGRTFKHYPTSQHPACRCVVSPIPAPSIIPTRPYETGEDWFARQPPAVQRKMLGSGRRYDLYREGFTLGDMTGTKQHPDWGETVVIRPISQLAQKGR